MPDHTAARGKALMWLGHWLRWQGEFAAAGRAADEAMAIFRDLGDEVSMNAARAERGLVCGNLGEYFVAQHARAERARTALPVHAAGSRCSSTGDQAAPGLGPG